MYNMIGINGITDIMSTNSMNRMDGMNERKRMNGILTGPDSGVVRRFPTVQAALRAGLRLQDSCCVI